MQLLKYSWSNYNINIDLHNCRRNTAVFNPGLMTRLPTDILELSCGSRRQQVMPKQRAAGGAREADDAGGDGSKLRQGKEIQTNWW